MQVDLLKTTYKPSENEEYMCDNHRQYFKEKLLLWRRELLAKSEMFFEDLKDNNVRPADTLDQSAQQAEIFVDFITRERLGQLVQEIELALDRIEAGEYGYCEITDEEIGLKRLEAYPVATRCVEAQEQFERLIKVIRAAMAQSCGSHPVLSGNGSTFLLHFSLPTQVVEDRQTRNGLSCLENMGSFHLRDHKA